MRYIVKKRNYFESIKFQFFIICDITNPQLYGPYHSFLFIIKVAEESLLLTHSFIFYTLLLQNFKIQILIDF